MKDMQMSPLTGQKWIKLVGIFFLTCILLPFAKGQSTTLTINQVYSLARKNYPLIKQHDLISKTKDYSVSNAAKGYLPVLSFSGQATYQSTVTSFPFKIPVPGFVLPAYSKDQYKIYGQIDQSIYDGGLIKNQKETARINETIAQQNLEVELYSLFDRVNQVFFGILLIDEELKQNELLKKDLQNGIDKAKALVANGAAFRSSVDEISAQLLQAEQARIDLTATKRGFLSILSLFVNKPLDENTLLIKPASPVAPSNNNRPELLFFDNQKKSYDLQQQLLNVQLKPKLGFFLQGGYGRPGLNFLNNNFAWYYIGGIRLNWNLGSLYTFKNQKQLLNLGRETIDIQKETFLFNNQITQNQQSDEIQKYINLFKKDDEIIALRVSVKNAASAQLENGVLSTHDYITEVNAENEAKQNLILHQVQLLQAQYSYQNTMGNINNL